MQTLSKLFRLAALLAAVGTLHGCGGGGSEPPAPASAPAPTPAPTLAVVPATVLVTGTATYASVPVNTVTGALNYAGVVSKPIRGATVQAMSAGTVLASTVSSAQGTYSFTLPSNTNYSVRVRAEMLQPSGSATWNVAVKDNTAGDALWTTDGTSGSSGVANGVRSINAGSGWNGFRYTAARAAGPFAILDLIYDSMKLVTKVKAATQFPPLTVYWSPNNKPAAGNESIGEIGNTFFQFEPDPLGGADDKRSIYILGQQDIDTDEYDKAVVVHEYGHYLQSVYSRDDTVGGMHSPLDKLDMTLAFSEGWGYAWAGMVLNNPYLTNSLGQQQSIGVVDNLGVAPIDAERGWYREDSVQTSLYALYASQGFAPIWNAITGPMKDTQQALTSIFSFADAVRSAGNAAATNALNNILSAQNIFTGNGADQWGAGETNDGGDAGNLPVYSSLPFGVATPVCFINTNMTDGDVSLNKLGSLKYFRIKLSDVQSGVRTIRADFAAGRDIDFIVFQNRQALAFADSIDPISETTSLNLSAGDVILRVRDYVTTTPLTAPNCATITIN
jgi:hypothetical protein